MLKSRGNVNLGQEPLGAEYSCELREQHLHGNLPSVPQILSEVYGCHAAFAELTLDAVSVGERRDKTVG
jgi:hypothetical protein